MGCSLHPGLLAAILFAVCFESASSQLTACPSVWNDKYMAYDITYTTDDCANGVWPIVDPSDTEPICSGCSCNSTHVIVCTGTIVTLQAQTISATSEGLFSKDTTSITIIKCGLTTFHRDTFVNLTSLTTLVIQGTDLTYVPDLSRTLISTLNLAQNKIKMTTANYRGWTMPDLEYLAMGDNEIYWIPEEMITGANLRIVSFRNNNLTQIQSNIFGNSLGKLVYLCFSGNYVTQITGSNIRPLVSAAAFVHIDLSDNQLSFIQRGTFSQLPNLKILELQQNKLSNIENDSLSDMPKLLHLDLGENNLATLKTNTFENLPSLIELWLNSQSTPMKSIAYNAFHTSSLEHLYLHSNGLTSFPHPVLENGDYPKLEMIIADNNLITNLTEAFTTYPSLHTLSLRNNLITNINTTDLCYMTNLTTLYLSTNLIRESTMAADAFNCCTNLITLDLSSNLIQYVPDSLKSTDVIPAIQTLELASNKLTFLEAGAFSNLSTVLYLNLYNNAILLIENGVFPGQLEYLNLSLNEFRFMHTHPFSNLQSLVTLRLENNQIDYVPAGAFAGLTALYDLNLGENPLGCQCELVTTLDDVSSHITGGECQFPTDNAGVTFVSSQSGTANYYTNQTIYCSGENVVATSSSQTDIQVQWDKPSVIVGDPVAMNYTLTCVTVSETAATLTSDTPTEVTSTTFSVAFDSTDGVIAATQYECAVKIMYTYINITCNITVDLLFNATCNASDPSAIVTEYTRASAKSNPGFVITAVIPVSTPVVNVTSNATEGSNVTSTSTYDSSVTFSPKTDHSQLLLPSVAGQSHTNVNTNNSTKNHENINISVNSGTHRSRSHKRHQTRASQSANSVNRAVGANVPRDVTSHTMTRSVSRSRDINSGGSQ